MRWARISVDGTPRTGIIEDDLIALVNGGMFDGGTRTGETIPLAKVQFMIPFEPRTFYAAGLNYAEHVIEQAKANKRDPELPEKPDIGYRANNALIAHGEAIVKPRDASEEFQYEAELVVVIGQHAKNLSEDQALSCVFGYTIGNDVSERRWQRRDRTLWRAKNTDTFKPMGPWVETNVDLEGLETVVRLSGREVIRFPTNNMIFSVARYISAMSRYVTLEARDMIWMGTEGHSENMQPGDVCEIEISGVGTLCNLIVLET